MLYSRYLYNTDGRMDGARARARASSRARARELARARARAPSIRPSVLYKYREYNNCEPPLIPFKNPF